MKPDHHCYHCYCTINSEHRGWGCTQDGGEERGKNPSRSSRAPVLLSLRAECVGMLSASFHWSYWMEFFFLVFHAEVSSGAWGQASKTAPRSGLAPINVLAHNGAWQARLWPSQLLGAQPSDRATPAQVSREGRVKFFKLNGKCCYFTPCECIAIFCDLYFARPSSLASGRSLRERVAWDWLVLPTCRVFHFCYMFKWKILSLIVYWTSLFQIVNFISKS